ncbi:MAG: hypothetical protein AAGA40_01655 [Cyanobacteria bacterium P01_E01_bin.45]
MTKSARMSQDVSKSVSSAPVSSTGGNERQDRSAFPYRQLASRWRVLLWIVVWLILVDVGLTVLFPFPRMFDERPTWAQRYFDRGRSVEGKLNRMVGDDLENSAPIISSGWIDPNDWRDLPQAPQGDDDLLVSFYGMSFTNRASDALVELDGNITTRNIAAPSAPPNHTFAAYMADEEGRNADYAVFGILASSIRRMRSMSGMNWTYSYPTPYTYPYYTLDDEGALVANEPAISTAPEFLTAFNRQDETWTTFEDQLERYDYPFKPLLFHTNAIDRSVFLRFMRSEWIGRTTTSSEAGLYEFGQGFNPDAEQVRVLQAMLADFSQTARDAGQVPVVMLFSNRGYGSDLYDVLASELARLDVLVLDTNTIAPANDPASFARDGHFTDEANINVVRALREMIRAEGEG